MGNYLAVPELIKPGKWKINPDSLDIDMSVFEKKGHLDTPEDFAASVDISSLVFKAPMGKTDKDTSVRMHEYGHIRWSPKYVPNEFLGNQARLMSLQAAEDCRINRLIHANFKASKESRRIFESNGITTMTNLAILMNTKLPAIKKLYAEFSEMPPGTPEAQGRFHLLITNLFGIVTMFYTHLGYNHPKDHSEKIRMFNLFIRKLLRSAKFSTIFDGNYLRNIVDLIPREFRCRPYTNFEEYSPTLAKCFLKILQTKPPESRSEEGKTETKFIDDSDAMKSSGVMAVKDAMLSGNTQLKAKFRRQEMGMHIKAPHRIYTDGYCFSEKLKKPYSGTVLVDCSGSMSINLDMLQEIVDKSAGITIGAYSGDTKDGILWILSKGKKICKDLPKFQSGNIIDYPSLLWLLGQPKPWFWVCDGGVTGNNDSTYQSITSACKDITARNPIMQFRKLPDFYTHFMGKEYNPDPLVKTLKRRLLEKFGKENDRDD